MINPVLRKAMGYHHVGVCKNIRFENPPIRSELLDIRSDFKISDISDRVSRKKLGFRIGYGSGFFKNVNEPDSEIRSERFGYPKSSDIRKFRIGFGSQFLRSEIFGYPNFQIGSDPISDIEHPYHHVLKLILV